METGNSQRSDEEGYHPVPTHGAKVIPKESPPATAWTESETGSPDENKRLLEPLGSPKPRLQDGLTLAVTNAPKTHKKCPSTSRAEKSKVKKRTQKVIEFFNPPYFISSMIVLIVCIHLWGSKDLRASLEWVPREWWREPWRLLTYGCVHANGAHLALNSLIALAVGWRLEKEQGWWRVVCVWCGGVAAGALGAGVLQPQVRVVGASAAVYALLTAHIPNVCLRFGHIPLWWYRPLSVVVLGTSEGIWALTREDTSTYATASHTQVSNNHIAWSAHALGAAAGISLAFLVFTGEHNSKRYILVFRMLSGAVLLTGVIAAALYFSFVHEV